MYVRKYCGWIPHGICCELGQGARREGMQTGEWMCSIIRVDAVNNQEYPGAELPQQSLLFVG